ncbi:MAG TPA: FtsX-like permease family protein, partial [Gemmatimonadaceae bacterium]
IGFESIRLDGRALLFTFAVTLVVGILFGLVPALRATRADLARDLKDGSAAAGSGRRTGVSRRSLVVAEVALALVLLAGSGLMLRSLSNLLAVDPGFDPDNLLTLRISVPGGEIAPDSLPGFYDRLQEEIAALPGVQQVALGNCSPLSGGCNGTIMTFADRPQQTTGNAMVGVHWVSPSWFQTLRVPLVRGRVFSETDRLDAPKVVIINEEAARRYFPGEDPIGKRVAVYQGGFHTGAEVIGIVGNVRFGTIDSLPIPDVFISHGQARRPGMMIFVRTTGDPSALVPSVRERIRQFAPREPVYDVRPMSARMAWATSQARFSALLLGAFAAIALALAMLGIYGVMSFAVAQRTREIGIRMALGADKGRVLSLVVREGTLLAGMGVAIGLVAALMLTRVMRNLLFGVAPNDPWTYAAMIVLLAIAAFGASWIPARRAAGVDPVLALRQG